MKFLILFFYFYFIFSDICNIGIIFILNTPEDEKYFYEIRKNIIQTIFNKEKENFNLNYNVKNDLIIYENTKLNDLKNKVIQDNYYVDIMFINEFRKLPNDFAEFIDSISYHSVLFQRFYSDLRIDFLYLSQTNTYYYRRIFYLF